MAYMRNTAAWVEWIGADDERHFWQQVDVQHEDMCWYWTGATSNGYGSFYVSFVQRDVGAHVVAYLLSTGDSDLDGFLIHHSCHNKPCCNPAHLGKGNQRDNILDNLADDLHYGIRKLMIADVLEIDGLLRQGYGRETVAAQFDVSKAAIVDLDLGRNWSWLTGR